MNILFLFNFDISLILRLRYIVFKNALFNMNPLMLFLLLIGTAILVYKVFKIFNTISRENKKKLSQLQLLPNYFQLDKPYKLGNGRGGLIIGGLKHSMLDITKHESDRPCLYVTIEMKEKLPYYGEAVYIVQNGNTFYTFYIHLDNKVYYGNLTDIITKS